MSDEAREEERIAAEVDKRFEQVLNILKEVQELQPRTPYIFYALGDKKFLSRSGMDLLQLGMITEIGAVITLPSAQAFHALDAQQKRRGGPRVLNPHTGRPVE